MSIETAQTTLSRMRRRNFLVPRYLMDYMDTIRLYLNYSMSLLIKNLKRPQLRPIFIFIFKLLNSNEYCYLRGIPCLYYKNKSDL